MFRDNDQVAIMGAEDPTAQTQRYLVASLINNTSAPTQHKSYIHSWLTSMPSSIVIQTLENLPTAFALIVRERVFAAALRYNDLETAQKMLLSGVDPREPIQIGFNHDSGIQPLCWAITHGQFFIAKALLERLSEIEAQSALQSLTDHLVQTQVSQGDCPLSDRLGIRLSDPERWSLVGIPLSCGATPTLTSLLIICKNIEMVQDIITPKKWKKLVTG